MKKLLAVGMALVGVYGLFAVSAQAQTTDPSCYYQNAAGQIIDLGELCGPRRPVAPSSAPRTNPTPPANTPAASPARPAAAPAANRSTECRQLGDTILAQSISGEIVPYPSTPAERQGNAQVASQLQQVIQAIAPLPLRDSNLRSLQELAVAMYQDSRSLALAYNQVGSAPTQNQGFAVDATAMRVLFTANALSVGFEEYCGYVLF